MSLEKTFNCRFVLTDGAQFEGKFTINNRDLFERYLRKHKLYKEGDHIDSIVFEDMTLSYAGERKEF